MPELPEVETVRRSLERRLPGRTVVEILVREPRLRRMVDERRLDGLLRDRRVTGIERRAKYLIFHFEGGARMVAHLGMTGQLLLLPGDAPFNAHDHVIFTLDDDSQLRFRDPRRFGLIEALAEDEMSQFAQLARLGVEPLSADFTSEYLFERSRGSRQPVKNFLMDQQVVVGVGNIYASEALFLAGVHPLRAAGRIGAARWGAIVEAVRDVLRQAIRAGGTTLSDFRDGEGNTGYFQVELRAYGRAGEPCLRCRRPIRRRVLAGRSTFYCAGCQR